MNTLWKKRLFNFAKGAGNWLLRTTNVAVVGGLSTYLGHKLLEWHQQPQESENEQVDEYGSGWEVREDPRDAQSVLYDGNVQYSDVYGEQQYTGDDYVYNGSFNEGDENSFVPHSGGNDVSENQ